MTSLMATDRGCSYDRAGLGLSAAGADAPDDDDQVDDLHALLAAAGLDATVRVRRALVGRLERDGLRRSLSGRRRRAS